MKTTSKHAPIENWSLFSAKKRVPNPQVPEPGRMLLRQEFECKSFLVLIVKILIIYGSGTNSVHPFGPFPAILTLQINSGIAVNDGNIRILSLELLGLKCAKRETLDLTVMGG